MRATWRLTLALLISAACTSDVTTEPALTPSQIATLSHDPLGPTALDQSQPNADAVSPITFAIGGQSNQVLAQTFTPGVSGRLREVELPIACDGGRLQVEIRDAPSGTPGTTVFASEVFTIGDVPSAFPPGGPVPFSALRVRPSPRLTAGVLHAIVVSNLDGPAESCGYWPGPVGDPYAAGNGWFMGTGSSGWVNISLGNGREDLPFFTYMQ